MKLIGLDLDGTLEDSRDDMVAAARRVRAQLALPVREDAALRPWVNAGMDQLYRQCFDDFLAVSADTGADRYRIVQRAYDAEYLANVAVHTRLYEGVADALHALAELGTLACITNKPEQISRALLAELGVGALFATVVGGDSCADCKPNPIMLRSAAERCGLDPAHRPSFMIGDTAGDIKLGRAFGATTVWCAWGYSDGPGDTPDHVASTPRELAQILARAA